MYFNTKNILAASAIALMSLTTSSFAQQPQDNGNAALLDSLTNAETETPIAANHVVATINGEDITIEMLDMVVTNIAPDLARLPQDARNMAALKLLIDNRAFAQAAIEANLDKTDAYNRQMELMRNVVLQQLYFSTQVVDKITDEDLQKRYDELVSQIQPETEVHARHILVKTQPEAQAIIERLDNGEDFAVIAREQSIDGAAATGGDLGYFTAGQMVKPFSDAAFAIEPGHYTETPVETDFGWHIIKVEDKRERQAPAFDQVKETIRSMIVSEIYTETAAAAREKLTITYDSPQTELEMQKMLNMGDVPADEEEAEILEESE